MTQADDRNRDYPDFRGSDIGFVLQTENTFVLRLLFTGRYSHKKSRPQCCQGEMVRDRIRCLHLDSGANQAHYLANNVTVFRIEWDGRKGLILREEIWHSILVAETLNSRLFANQGNDNLIAVGGL